MQKALWTLYNNETVRDNVKGKRDLLKSERGQMGSESGVQAAKHECKQSPRICGNCILFNTGGLLFATGHFCLDKRILY